ncbi:MAG: AAA family ATPase [Turicibacter sp.]|nr:AAA family ATPase [Turicibacter sp.]
MRKTLPLSTDDFRDVRERNHYYVDKTLLVQEFLSYQTMGTLITRPRRFGKTLKTNGSLITYSAPSSMGTWRNF